jgi:hypothetical protein
VRQRAGWRSQTAISGAGPLGAAQHARFGRRDSCGATDVFDGAYWAFNLSTRGLASGTYSLSVVSGDENTYVIDPTCEVDVVIK